MSTEEWRDVVGSNGAYQVSNMGGVRSKTRTVKHKNGRPSTTRSGKLLKPGIASHGYKTVSINGKSRTVHSIVLEAFVGPRPSSRHECRHIDGVKTNCNLNNLSWGTYEENQRDKVKHGTSNRCRGYKLTSDDVIEIRNIIKSKDRGNPTYLQIGLEFGVSQSTIHNIGTGKSWGWL